MTSFSSFFKKHLGSQLNLNQEGVEIRRTLSVAFKLDISWRGSFWVLIQVECRWYWNPCMWLEVGLKMKGDNKERNIGRSEEFTLVGQENTIPSPLQHSPQMPVLLSPRGCFPFCCTCLFSIKSRIPWRLSCFCSLSSHGEWDETRQTWF